MKLNKTIITLALLLASATQLTACTIEDDELTNSNDTGIQTNENNQDINSQQIQSDWAIPSQLLSDDDDSENEAIDQFEDITSFIVIHLGGDNQFMTLQTNNQFNPECYIERGSYKIVGNEITFNAEIENETKATYSLTSKGQNLFLTLDILGDDPYTMTLLEVQLSHTQLNSIKECSEELL